MEKKGVKMMQRFIKLMVLTLLLCLPVPSALGQHDLPVLPAICYGKVTIEGKCAPAGVKVEAITDGIVCGKLFTSENGCYGGPGIQSKLAVSGNQLDGNRIDFYITGSCNGKEYKQVKAGEALYWGSGEVKEINLKIESSPPSVDPSPPSPSGGGNGGGFPKKPKDDTNVATLSEKLFNYQTRVAENGQIIEDISISTDAGKEITQAKEEGKTTIEINLNCKDKSSIKILTLPAEVVKSARNMNIQLNLTDITIEIPASIINKLAANNGELEVSLQQGDVSAIRQEIAVSQEAQGATVLGKPIEIKANIKGKTSIMLPLTGIKIPEDPAERQMLLSNLAVFAIHSDGEKELIQGELVSDKDGLPLAIRFNTSKFSTFTIVKLSEKPKSICNDISGSWAESSIRNLLASGAISGYPDGSFKPDQKITRAEFTAVLVRAFKLTSTEGKIFTDTNLHWAREYIATAAAHGIVQGCSDTVFAPEQLITREQMAVMIVKASALEKTDHIKKFSDEAKVSSWAREAIDIAAGHQLISGYPDGSFRPLNNATRAETATIIVTALKKNK
ncbi:MAG: S-layer homology domain-containing protein [Syntrophomonadaceae bacterium]|nr:S-layer homology domain-containing protein [Syntrophomonadaceae bacterium]